MNGPRMMETVGSGIEIEVDSFTWSGKITL